MNNKPIETKPSQVTESNVDLVLNDDEIEQLAKFLDALLESGLSTKSDGGNDND